MIINKNYDYDFIVIGSGPGGQKATIQASKANKTVAIIEKDKRIGGTCIYQGTIPSKTLRSAALSLSTFRKKLKQYNLEVNEQFDSKLQLASLMEKLDNVLDAQNNFIDDYLRRNNVDIIHGRAGLIDDHTVSIMSIDGSSKNISAENIIISTGSRPRTPSDINVDHENIFDSDSILSIMYIPKSMTILGGGVIACEYASIFAELGTKVTLIDKAPRPLMFMDEEIVENFINQFEKYGSRYIGEGEYETVVFDGVSNVITKLKSGETIVSEKCLFALGRVANVEYLNLKSVGVNQSKRGLIEVNDEYRTNFDNVYAVGDVIGFPALASTSMEQGRRAVCHALNIEVGYSFNAIPIGIYAIPEIASIGITESEAFEKFKDIQIGRAEFSEVAKGLIVGHTEGLLKLISDAKGEKILGVHIIGEGATELIHLGELAVLNNNTVSSFIENIFNFPTMAELYRIAALNLLNKL